MRDGQAGEMAGHNQVTSLPQHMSRPERVTIDMTVIIDLLTPGVDRHGDALKLLEMARSGQVEIAIAPQGHLHDNPSDRVGDLRRTYPDVRFEELPQLAYLSDHTYPSPNLYPGNYDLKLAKAMRQVSIGDKDAWHVETHYVEGRDVFITDDDRLKRRVKRLNSEHGFEITVMCLEEYIEARRPPGSSKRQA